MRLRASTRGLGTAAGTSIALAVLLCAWPSQAEARCSPYVIGYNHAGESGPQLGIVSGGDVVDVLSETPVRQRPCTGVLCSGKPAVPVAIPVAVHRHAEAVIPRSPEPPGSTSKGEALAYAERIVRAVIEKPSIERPPR